MNIFLVLLTEYAELVVQPFEEIGVRVKCIEECLLSFKSFGELPGSVEVCSVVVLDVGCAVYWVVHAWGMRVEGKK